MKVIEGFEWVYTLIFIFDSINGAFLIIQVIELGFRVDYTVFYLVLRFWEEIGKYY